MLDALLNILNGFTDIPFVELAWSHSPDDKYGVINLDNQIALNADADPVIEKMLTGFVDVFVKKPKDLSTVSDVESAMKRLGIYFALNSVQFEDDTGYVHYEWEFKDTTNIVASQLYVVKFHAHNGYVGEPQIVSNNNLPVIPTVDPYELDGLNYLFYQWNEPVTVATQNAEYDALYYIEIRILYSNGVYHARTYIDGRNKKLTSEQIETVIAWFDGNKVACVWNGDVIAARDVTVDNIIFAGITAVWN